MARRNPFPMRSNAIPRYMQRPTTRNLTPDFVYDLGSIGCTQEEIGQLCGVSQPRISQVFSAFPELKEAWEQGLAVAKVSLRRAQMKKAVESENVVAQIWLGKQMLGQADKTETKSEHTDVQVRFIARWGGEHNGALPPAPQDAEVVEASSEDVTDEEEEESHGD